MRRIDSRILTLSLAFSIAACSGDDATTPTPTPPPPIDASGGIAESAAANAWASIPAGAITGAPVQITITEMNKAGYPNPAGRWTNVFEFAPDGTSFAIPVTVVLALPDSLADSTATLWGLNTTTNQWEEVPGSLTSLGRVWGQTTHFSAYSAAEASNPDSCTSRDAVLLRETGFISVIPGRLDSELIVSEGTVYEQELGSTWTATKDTVNVSGRADPPLGMGGWIDFATGPNYETGTFVIDAAGYFDFDIDIPPSGRLLGLTDGCLLPTATPDNGWLYNLKIQCDSGCLTSAVEAGTRQLK